ncbi:putative enoyl-CoA hydratase/isomerase [Actinoplanes missouriensis 431]|uniref:Putative enoyl-CoA hydratase/isomerase n=1 Tax=Actinoplanes missouriensis (strain ATCC 14538 / DSM 43046 / CBS 188.64 / JCM 3121 / NBRC 102363 / NCIMB 12654 / NRRL B-3342 / UNCC 431) TaxID=512565 RepID=I0H952_ACTM4|nr:enoyl-CoA hydratase-related protein [Actinoplanes missouriensis]BAL89539.1 putative enoyl-CoA hydratase/isomerase [Actinoplanes missouriensis 431]
MTAAAPEIGCRRDGPVLRITLNRPHVLNAVTETVLRDLADLITEAGEDPEVRVLVLAGAGRAFSSGADLTTVTEISSPAGTIHAANQVIRSIGAVPQPVVAAVQGAAAGVGCSIALACDLVLASSDAYFQLAFVRVGLMPDGGATLLVPAGVGRARAMSLALLGDRLPAATAAEWGLIHRVVDPASLAAGVDDLAGRLSRSAPLALAATKRAVNAATLGGLEDSMGRELEGQSALLTSADFQTAVSAFREKKTPDFAGR